MSLTEIEKILVNFHHNRDLLHLKTLQMYYQQPTNMLPSPRKIIEAFEARRVSTKKNSTPVAILDYHNDYPEDEVIKTTASPRATGIKIEVSIRDAHPQHGNFYTPKNIKQHES